MTGSKKAITLALRDRTDWSRELCRAGMPLFYGRWIEREHRLICDKQWQRSERGEKYLTAVRWPRVRCHVCGIAFDVLDEDRQKAEYRADWIDRDLLEKCSYAMVTTPSGGLHWYIPALGFRKSPLFPAVDYQGGAKDGSGRGMVFAPGIVKPSKVTGQLVQYELRWLSDSAKMCRVIRDSALTELRRLIRDRLEEARTAGNGASRRASGDRPGITADSAAWRYSQRNMRLLAKDGIPEGLPHDHTLARLVYGMAGDCFTREKIWRQWLAVVDATEPRDPGWPFTRRDFDRHMKNVTTMDASPVMARLRERDARAAGSPPKAARAGKQ